MKGEISNVPQRTGPFFFCALGFEVTTSIGKYEDEVIYGLLDSYIYDYSSLNTHKQLVFSFLLLFFLIRLQSVGNFRKEQYAFPHSNYALYLLTY